MIDAKEQVLKEINTNNELKEAEIAKMNELEGKIKTILDKMNDEKKIYVQENTQMAKELLEIKELLTSAMG